MEAPKKRKRNKNKKKKNGQPTPVTANEDKSTNTLDSELPQAGAATSNQSNGATPTDAKNVEQHMAAGQAKKKKKGRPRKKKAAAPTPEEVAGVLQNDLISKMIDGGSIVLPLETPSAPKPTADKHGPNLMQGNPGPKLMKAELPEQPSSSNTNKKNMGSKSKKPPNPKKGKSQMKQNGPQHQNTPPQNTPPQHQKKKFYETYWSAEKVGATLKVGQALRGCIRINPRNYLDAYISDGPQDILVQGMPDRNRSLNGDEVVIVLHHKSLWKVQVNQIEALSANSKDTVPNTGPRPTLEDYVHDLLVKQNTAPQVIPISKQQLIEQFKVEFLQRTARVVYIMERKHGRVCAGHITHMENRVLHVAKFNPIDTKVPRLLLDINSCPGGFKERPADFATQLYIAKITSWGEYSLMPNAELARSLGESGEIEPETEGILLSNDVDYAEFSERVLACLPQALPWSIPSSEYEYRRDFRSDCIFTIDPATARDLDDAVSCMDLGSGIYEVGVHIADVSFFIDEGSPLDKVAAERSTSVYLIQKVIHMLPRLLCEELCSLNPDIDRLAFSVVWKMTEYGEIIDEWFGRSIIRSCAKLSYQHAQRVLDKPDITKDDLPAISEGFTVDMIKERIVNLNKIAKNLRKNRFDSGALKLDQIKVQFHLNDKTGLPSSFSVYQIQDSNRLIEEFMLLANMAVAHQLQKHYPDKALLRRHPPPHEKPLEDLAKMLDNMGIKLDTTSSKTLHDSLIEMCGTDFTSSARAQILVSLCSKPMQNALYFSTGSFTDQYMFRHYALNVPLYTHFTSPIRRYPDVLVHRLLAASLGYIKTPVMTSQKLENCCKHSNKKKENAKVCSMASSDLYFNVFVRKCGPLYEKGMVMDVLNKSFDVLLLRLGVVKRVYCEQLPLDSFSFHKQDRVLELRLSWKRNKVTQPIRLFTEVNCVLEKAEQVLKVTTLIRHPHDFVQQHIDGENTPGMAIINGQLNTDRENPGKSDTAPENEKDSETAADCVANSEMDGLKNVNNDTAMTETENNDTPVTEPENNDIPMTETKNNDTAVTKIKNNDTPLTEPDNNDTSSNGTKNNDTGAIETENNDTAVTEIKNNDTPLTEPDNNDTSSNGTKNNDTGAIETENNDTAVTEIKNNDTAVTDTESTDTPLTDTVDRACESNNADDNDLPSNVSDEKAEIVCDAQDSIQTLEKVDMESNMESNITDRKSVDNEDTMITTDANDKATSASNESTELAAVATKMDELESVNCDNDVVPPVKCEHPPSQEVAVENVTTSAGSDLSQPTTDCKVISEGLDALHIMSKSDSDDGKVKSDAVNELNGISTPDSDKSKVISESLVVVSIQEDDTKTA